MKGQDLIKNKYKDNVQVCMVPDANAQVDNPIIVGRTLSITNGGMATVALLNPNEERLELSKGARVAKVHLVRTRNIRMPKEDYIKHQRTTTNKKG